ncbi:MarR family winged helix-turn-helix transcriptional regulator [Allosediminivita pacifica]|uniref:MarR family transcriptional regulator for hemolysin n=1 Tax=Allosediminivita pacifica TaxID=1267769 RepID=A0A2T6B7Q7_9RHOB|nr:MarR family transcriptional regulator [Allosediminivita pacifica]PTX52120.1 MarR family transcriptional regulator for hemolysin [Allosediminivita pacifica]GGA96993.1 MarR family transcriptional regulator [Allosediminivita pacifica]
MTRAFTSQQKMLDSMQRVVREMRRAFDTEAQATGLTLSRARLLRMLTRMEGGTQAELAAELGIEAPSVKRQIDGLVRDGYVERREIEGDCRKRALFLTERAKQDQVTRFADRVRSQAMEGLSDEELDAARAVLDRIAANVGDMGRR